uniref:Endoglucanase n=1 Tax=Arundo donax TaxID=35708 RepID=A0A0A9ES92_ARUDO
MRSPSPSSSSRASAPASCRRATACPGAATPASETAPSTMWTLSAATTTPATTSSSVCRWRSRRRCWRGASSTSAGSWAASCRTPCPPCGGAPTPPQGRHVDAGQAVRPGGGPEPGPPVLGAPRGHGHAARRLRRHQGQARLRRRRRDRRRARRLRHRLPPLRPCLLLQAPPRRHEGVRLRRPPPRLLQRLPHRLRLPLLLLLLRLPRRAPVGGMSYVQVNGMQLGAGDDDYSFSWDDKRVGTKVLLSKGFLRKKLPGLRLYKAHSDNYICSLLPGTSSFQSGQYTPGGLIYKEGASNMQYVTTATFLLLAYAKYLRSSGATVACGGARDVSPGELVALAKRQVDYILGKNPAGMSYMVGFGDRYPRRLHHRGASMPSVRAHPGRIGCDEGFRYLHSGAADQNVLVGAVVGGPDARDAFADDRDSYGQSEPATYINAPLVGALAFFAGTARQ